MNQYDDRLDSPDAIIRQQAEIEALRTALTAARSESDGELDRLRSQLSAMTESYEGQKRNTLAFKRELDELADAMWEYGQHRKSCRIDSGQECDCGFFDIIKSLNTHKIEA